MQTLARPSCLFRPLAFQVLLCLVTSSILGTAQGNSSLEAIGSRLKTTHPSAGTAHLLEIAHGDGSLVTVGEQGTLAISEDAGTTWQIVDLGFDISDNLLDVAYGAGRYLVAAGSKGMLTALREDLTRWELTGVPDISSPTSIDYLNGQFFAMGRGRIATSVDGLSWQELPSIPEGSFTDITYGAGLYVLVGSSGIIYSSSDLQTWFLEDSDLVDWEKNSHLYGVTYAGDVFMAAGYSGLFITSPDGTNWTRRDPPVTRFLYDGAYFAGAYWISGGGSNFYKTTDFIDWEKVSHQGNESATVFVITSDALFSAGRLGTLVKTTDGETWENMQGGRTKDFSDLVFARDHFIACNYNGEIFVSEDGKEWQTVLDLSEDNVSFAGLEDTEGFLYAIGSNGPVYRTADGLNWEEAGSTPSRVESFCYNEGTWVIGGRNGSLAWSTDLTTWETFEQDTIEFVTGLAYGNGRYVAMGSRGLVVHSGPDFQWQPAEAIPSVSTRSSLGFIDGRFLSPGQGKTWHSTDGNIWVEVEGFGASISNTITKIEGTIVAHGYLGSFWTSEDGNEWENVRTRSDASITGMAYGNDRWVTVGSRGSVMATEPETTWRVLLGHEGNGTVEASVPLTDPIADGAEVTFTAVPDDGYILAHWDDLDTEDLTATVTIESDLILRAVFIPRPFYTFEVEIQSGEETGSVSFDPMLDTYGHGSEVTITALPAEGYQFQRWQGSISSRDNPLTLEMLRDHTLIASFSKIPRYTLTSRITGEGSVQISPEQEDYLRETEITLTAIPEPGFAFVRWIGQVTGSANPLVFPIRRNSVVTAIFEPAETTYALEIDTLGIGTVEVSPEGSEFTAGTDVTLTPQPDAGFVFHRWTGAAGGSAVPLVINMDSAKAITAEFVSNESYERWTLDHFGALASDESIAGRMADPDGDGRTNAEEFALISNPNKAHSMPHVSTSLVPIGGKPYFTLSWQQRSLAVITPEVADDLIGFAPATVTTISEEPVEGATGIIAKSIRLSEPITHSWRGMRLKIDLP